MIRYPTVEQILRSNMRYGGDAGVRDLGLIEAAAARPQQEFGGVQAYDTLFEKAAVLLHSLASTQGFCDGNKRTAWNITVTFLQGNGRPVRGVAPIEAEAFVMSVAVSAWTNRTVAKAAEWLEEQALGMTDLPADEIEVLIAYRTQPYIGLGLPPFVVIKTQSVPMPAVAEGSTAKRRRANLAVSAREARELARIIHEAADALPPHGTRRRRT